MLTEALFITLKGLSSDKWLENAWYVYKIECYLAFTMREILPLVKLWITLEDILLTEIFLTQTDKLQYDLMCMWYLEMFKQGGSGMTGLGSES